jgi:hypothetical protein
LDLLSFPKFDTFDLFFRNAMRLVLGHGLCEVTSDNLVDLDLWLLIVLPLGLAGDIVLSVIS